jgi:hypothetical protein
VDSFDALRYSCTATFTLRLIALLYASAACSDSIAARRASTNGASSVSA